MPNHEVLDAAEQFHSAYRVLAERPPSGVLLPELHCAFIALELYLKALSAIEVEVPDTTFGLGVTIYARATSKSHKLEKLYDLVALEDRRIIDSVLGEKDRLREFATTREALAHFTNMFMSSRYPFEPESSFEGIEMSRLAQLLDAIEEAITMVRRRWEMYSA